MIEYSRANFRVWSMLGSRRTLGVAVDELADQYEDFTFVTADVGRYYAINRFIEKHPEKMINVGIAEQNMIGVAAAMVKEGYNVFAASYATFITARVLDQIRVNLGLMGLGVKLIGVGAGFSEGDMSATHMGLEDIANIRAIPGITILSPADCTETMKAMEAAAAMNGPVYIRLTGVANNPIVYTKDYEYQVGRAITLREGQDVAIVATGTMVNQSLKAAKLLEEVGISATVVDMHTIKPLDMSALKQLMGYRAIITVEEHMMAGGMGSAIAEALCTLPKRPPQLIIGVPDEYPVAAEYGELIEGCGLTAPHIAEKIKRFLSEIGE